MRSFFAIVVLLAAIILPVVFWYGFRIEPENGEIAVLIRKTGKPLPQGEVIATEAGQQGIQLEVLGEGRYFRNPYVWDWEIVPVTEVKAGQFAVLVRKYGKNLSDGRIIAEDVNSKGIVPEVLGTGRHRINPYAYEVRMFDDVKIMPGNVGVVVNLTGNDIFTGCNNDFGNQDGFLVASDAKGIVKDVLKEGTHRLNPYIYNVISVNIQSQRHEFSGEDAISFLTMDGFSVSLEGTVEFNIIADQAPRLVHVIGDMEDILKKIILPSVHGFARIEGSKKVATDFIVGESRRVFQSDLEKFLQENCSKWGINVNSVLIRDIIVPQEIAEIIRNRELSQQEARKYTQEMQRARSEAALAREKMLAEQNQKKIAAETEKIAAVIQAQQKGQEAEIAAQSRLKVAEIDFSTAEAEATAALNIAEAQRGVIAEQNARAVEVLTAQVAAFGSSDSYTKSLLYSKLMPNISSIMYNGANQDVFGLPLWEPMKPKPKPAKPVEPVEAEVEGGAK